MIRCAHDKDGWCLLNHGQCLAYCADYEAMQPTDYQMALMADIIKGAWTPDKTEETK